MTWELSSRLIVASLIQGTDTIKRQKYVLGLTPELLSPKWREFYRRAQDVTPAIETLAKTDADIKQLSDLYAVTFTPEDVDKAALECADEAEYDAILVAARKAEAAVKARQKPSHIRSEVIFNMSASRRSVGQKNDGRSILKRMRDSGKIASTAKTNIQWIDTKTKGGFRVGQFIVVGAPEKSRKTTFVRNIVMNALRENWVPGGKVAVQFDALENDQNITMADFVAMFAAEWIYYHGKAETIHRGQGEPLKTFCDATTAEYFIADPNYLKHPDLKAAFEYGYRMSENIEIEVLDRNEKSGGLRTMEDIVEKKREFCETHAGKHVIIVVDYAQIVKGKGTLFERIESFSDLGLSLAMEGEGCTIIALSQFSREGKKEENAKSDIIFSKGGADLEQACHYYFSCEYKEDLEEFLFVEMKRARRSGRGKVVFKIDPNSGLILESGLMVGKEFKSNGRIITDTKGLW